MQFLLLFQFPFPDMILNPCGSQHIPILIAIRGRDKFFGLFLDGSNSCTI